MSTLKRFLPALTLLPMTTLATPRLSAHENLSIAIEGMLEAWEICDERAESMTAFIAGIDACRLTIRHAHQIERRARLMRFDNESTPETLRTFALAQQTARLTSEAAKRRLDQQLSQLPMLPLGESGFSATGFMFISSLVVRLKANQDGDQIRTFSGGGGGLKLRYDYVSADTRRELVGFYTGVMFEQNVSTDSETSDPLISGVVGVSLLDFTYIGLGMTLFGASEFDLTDSNTYFLSIGIGPDGSAFFD